MKLYTKRVRRRKPDISLSLFKDRLFYLFCSLLCWLACICDISFRVFVIIWKAFILSQAHMKDYPDTPDKIKWIHFSGKRDEFQRETVRQRVKWFCLASVLVSALTYVSTLCDSADPPTIKKTQSSETQVGRMGTLQCDATAVPTPEFEWYRDEKR